MRPPRSTYWFMLSLAIIMACGLAWPESNLRGRLQSVFDNVAKGINYVGQQAGRIIGDGFGLGETPAAEFTEIRPVSQRVPVEAAPVVSVANEFGEIRVTTWGERVVEVAAEIVVGADTAEAALATADAIEIGVDAQADAVAVRTRIPEARPEGANHTITVNYAIKVPEGASVAARNFFGDTYIADVRGPVAVDAQYGRVELTRLGGPAEVRANGEFPLRATELAQGGEFDVHGATAEFRRVSGELSVSSFRGSVLVAEVPDDARINVSADSSSTRLLLPPGARPGLSATIFHGSMVSAVPGTRTAQGNRLVVHAPNPEASRQVVVNASFGHVAVDYEGAETSDAQTPAMAGTPISDTQEQVFAPAPGLPLRIEAMPGSIQIGAATDGQVHVRATRIVRVPNAAAAPPALAALDLRAAAEQDQASIITAVTSDLASLDCTSARFDLHILCPPETPITVQAEEGLTALHGLSGAVSVHQAIGEIQATAMTGALELANQRGSIAVEACTGPVDVSTRYGSAELVRTSGPITARSTQGKLVVEEAGSSVQARVSGGDVRILALEGVHGEYDILAEEGDISLLLAPASNIALTVTTKAGGAVHSAFPLDGSIGGDTQQFHGRLGEGEQRVRLEAIGGDIYLD